MGRKNDLKPEEKQRTAECIRRGKISLDISKLRYTVNRFIENSDNMRRRSNKEKF